MSHHQATEHTISTTEQSETESIFSDVYDTSVYEKTLKNARIWLFVIAGFQFAMGIFEKITIEDPQVGWIAFSIDAFIAFIFLGLALWSKKKPVVAFTIALVLYILINVGFMLIDSSNIYKGFLIKIFVVIALVKANRDARKYENIRASIGKVIQ